MRRGFWRDAGNGWIEVERRRFPSPRGVAGGDLVRIGIRENTITALTSEGRAIPEAYLDPPLVASYLGNDLRDRWPVSIDDLPEHLIWSVLAAEDTNFLQHAGVSVLGIARAAWANVVAGEVKQGGSTLTQQLVKNIYLTQERTAKRKLREALLAVLVDWRYEKREILEAYLNEIYWGRSGSNNLMGVGAASRAYYAKDPSQLTLPEAAMLAGMIQSPANLSPISHPEAAKKRRDAILVRLAELRWITTSQAEAAIAEPVQPVRRPRPLRKTSYFGDYALAEARTRFGIQSLDDAGYQLLSTLDPDDQEAAEEAVAGRGGAAREGAGEGPRQVAAPGGAGLDRSHRRRRARLRRRPRLQQDPVRPALPGPPPGRLGVQADRLRRRLRAQGGPSGDLSRGPALHRAAAQRAVEPAEQRRQIRRVRRVGERPHRARKEPQRADRAARGLDGHRARGRPGPPAGHRQPARSLSGAGARRRWR